MSLNRYRLSDILLLTTIALVIDSIVGRSGLLGLRLFISIGIPITLLIYIRWGKYGLIPNGLLIFVHFIVHFVNFPVMIAHSIALCILSLGILFSKWKKLQVRNIEFQYVIIYFLSIYLTMLLVEWTALEILNQEVNLFGFFVNHSLNILISIGLLFMASKQNDLIVNMQLYLNDISEGNKKDE